MVNHRSKWATAAIAMLIYQMIFAWKLGLPGVRILICYGKLWLNFVDHLDFVLVEIWWWSPVFETLLRFLVLFLCGQLHKDHHVPLETPGSTQDMFLFFHRFGEAWTLVVLAACWRCFAAWDSTYACVHVYVCDIDYMQHSYLLKPDEITRQVNSISCDSEGLGMNLIPCDSHTPCVFLFFCMQTSNLLTQAKSNGKWQPCWLLG